MKRPQVGDDRKTPRWIRLPMERPWLIVAGCLAMLAVVGLTRALTLPRSNVDELLRAIDAAHAVPDEENAARILLALRRYKNDTGAWPADLRELGTCLPSETLLDPLRGKPFVYRPRGDNFLLYSVSVDGTDEGGKHPDDFLYWDGH